MKFSPSICQGFHITRSRQPLQSQYTLRGQALECVESSKYLSVNISRDLNWNNHINEIKGKANRNVKRNVKVSKGAKIRNRYNQVPHLTQDTNGKVTNS